MTDNHDPYFVLGVAYNTPLKDIKLVYRKLALQYHPDKAGPQWTSRFQQIQAAWEKIENGYTRPAPIFQAQSTWKPEPFVFNPPPPSAYWRWPYGREVPRRKPTTKHYGPRGFSPQSGPPPGHEYPTFIFQQREQARPTTAEERAKERVWEKERKARAFSGQAKWNMNNMHFTWDSRAAKDEPGANPGFRTQVPQQNTEWGTKTGMWSGDTDDNYFGAQTHDTSAQSDDSMDLD